MLLTEKSAGQLRVVTVGGKRALSTGRAMHSKHLMAGAESPKTQFLPPCAKHFPLHDLTW